MLKKIEVLFKLRFEIETDQYPAGRTIKEIVDDEMVVNPYEFVTKSYSVKPIEVKEVGRKYGLRVKKKNPDKR